MTSGDFRACDSFHNRPADFLLTLRRKHCPFGAVLSYLQLGGAMKYGL